MRIMIIVKVVLCFLMLNSSHCLQSTPPYIDQDNRIGFYDEFEVLNVRTRRPLKTTTGRVARKHYPTLSKTKVVSCSDIIENIYYKFRPVLKRSSTQVVDNEESPTHSTLQNRQKDLYYKSRPVLKGVSTHVVIDNEESPAHSTLQNRQKDLYYKSRPSGLRNMKVYSRLLPKQREESDEGKESADSSTSYDSKESSDNSTDITKASTYQWESFDSMGASPDNLRINIDDVAAVNNVLLWVFCCCLCCYLTTLCVCLMQTFVWQFD